MKYDFNIGSRTMKYIPSLIKIDSAIQTLMGGKDSQIHRQHGDCLSLG
jgi:hypothetical protein